MKQCCRLLVDQRKLLLHFLFAGRHNRPVALQPPPALLLLLLPQLKPPNDDRNERKLEWAREAR